MNIIEEVKKYVMGRIEEFKNKSVDHYDFWNEHIKYVYKESLILAESYNADKEIVALGSLLHDIALINEVGSRDDHHINGEAIAKEVLSVLGYDEEKMKRVLKCVYNHRSSKNAQTIEETCVADADILAHFDNIPMLFYSMYVKNKISINNGKEMMKSYLLRDYNDLSDRTKKEFKDRFESIIDIVIGK